MAIVDVEFIATANFSALIAQANAANASLAKLQATTAAGGAEKMAMAFSQFTGSLTNSGRFVSQMVTVQNSTNAFGKSLMAGKLTMAEYKRELTAYVMQREGMIDKLAAQNVRMAQSTVISRGVNPATGQMMAQVLTSQGALANTAANQAAFAAQRMAVLNKILIQGSHSLINWGKNTQWAGRQMMVGLSMPLLVIGSLAAKTFYDFDKELTRMVKVYGNGLSELTLQQAQAMKAQARQTTFELAKMYGTPIKQTAELFGTIAQAGYEGADLVKNVELTTQLATLGSVDSQQAWQSVLTLQNAFKISTDDLQASLDFLNATENSTVLSLQDVTAAIPRAAPAVKALGGDIKDLAAYLVAMREGGVPAAEAANAIKSSLASLINPTRKTRDVLNGFGIDLKQIVRKNAGDLTGTILAVQAAFDKLDPLQRTQSIAQAFGKFQFSKITALLNNLGKEGSQTQKVFELMNFTAGQLAVLREREITRLQNTASGKFKRAWGQITTDLAKFGEKFLNTATEVIKVVGKLIGFFDKLPKGVKGFLASLTLFAAFVGPIVMLTGVLANFVAYIGMGLVRLKALASGSKGTWSMMTPEMVAAEKASEIFDNAIMKQTDNIEVLTGAIGQLITRLTELAGAGKAASAALVSPLATPMGNAVASQMAMIASAKGLQSGHVAASAVSNSLYQPFVQPGAKPVVGAIGPGAYGVLAQTWASNQASSGGGNAAKSKSMSFFGGGPRLEVITKGEAAMAGAMMNVRRGIAQAGTELNMAAQLLGKVSAGMMAKIDADMAANGTISAETEKLVMDALNKKAKGEQKAFLKSGITLSELFTQAGAEVVAQSEVMLARLVEIENMSEADVLAAIKSSNSQLSAALSKDGKSKANAVKKANEAAAAAIAAGTVDARTRLAQLEQDIQAAVAAKTLGAIPRGGIAGTGGGRTGWMAGVTTQSAFLPAGAAGGGIIRTPQESAMLKAGLDKNAAASTANAAATEELIVVESFKTKTEREAILAQTVNSEATDLLTVETARVAAAEEISLLRGRPGGGGGVGMVPGAGGRVGGGMGLMGVGMALTMGSMFTKGGTQHGLMTAGMIAMMLPMLLQMPGMSKLAQLAGSTGVMGKGALATSTASRAGAAALRGGATAEAAGLAASTATAGAPATAIAGAVGSVAGVALGVVAVVAAMKGFQKAMENNKKTTDSFAQAGDRAITLMKDGYVALKVHTDGLGTAINKTSKEYQSLKNVVEQLPVDDPIQNLVKDISAGEDKYGFWGLGKRMINMSMEANAGMSIPAKMAAVFAEQINAGVDPEAAKRLIDVILEKAGQQGYQMEVDAQINQIKVKDPSSVSKALYGGMLKTFSGDYDIVDKIQGDADRVKANIDKAITSINDPGNRADLIEAFGGGPGGEAKFNEFIKLIESGSYTVESAGKQMGLSWFDMPRSLRNIAAEGSVSFSSLAANIRLTDDEAKQVGDSMVKSLSPLQKLDGKELVAGIQKLASDPSLIALNNTIAGQKRIQDAIVSSLGAQGTEYEKLLTSGLGIQQEMEAAQLAVMGMPAAMIQAAISAGTLTATLSTLSSMRAAGTKAQNAVVGATDFDKMVGHTGGGGSSGSGGGGGDPYAGQKSANQKKIDDEKKIISEIEKKREAEKKAFDEKKKQNDYLSKQADQQIKYREALAIGDFGSAALAKNQMIADQNTKSLDDAQQRKDDAFQKQIDKHQAIIDKQEEVNKGLDKLSQKAASTQSAIMDTHDSTVTSVKNLMNDVLGNIDTTYAHNKDELIKYNPTVAEKLTKLGVNTDAFWDAAFKASSAGLRVEVDKIPDISKDLRNNILKAQLSLAEIQAFAAWITNHKNATPKQISDQLLRVQSSVFVGEGSVNASATSNSGSNSSSGSGTWGMPSTRGSTGSHSGGPISSSMSSSFNRPSMRSRIGSDEMFLIAQHGEYMINASAAGIIGRKNLDALNSGKIPAVPVSGGGGGSNYSFTVNAAPGQDPRQIAQEVQRIFQINERRKGGARK